MNKNIYIIIAVVLLLILGAGSYWYYLSTKEGPKTTIPKPAEIVAPREEPKTPETVTLKLEESVKTSEVAPPIANHEVRITKKPYGKFVSPGNSPVSPERFTGYHTATDFETTPEEVDLEIKIMAITDGEIILKQFVTGYGGLIIQKAKIAGQEVTILYGHVDTDKSTVSVGQVLKKGQEIAILAPAYSGLSGNERKHLHLGIHKGTNIEYLGYIPTTARLSEWLNPENLF